ncbi:MAG TPA: hypothetical protein VKF62_06510 [Planctomycetota bacterium]|nr:hypothetical protein [Planctomycetota bacterium]
MRGTEGASPEGFRRKALRSLEAGHLLLGEGLVDDATSRLHYAVFQGGVYGLEARTREPREFRSTDWDPLTVARCAVLLRGRPEDIGLFDTARELRQNADDDRKSVQRRWVEFLRRDVERFVIDVTR